MDPAPVLWGLGIFLALAVVAAGGVVGAVVVWIF